MESERNITPNTINAVSEAVGSNGAHTHTHTAHTIKAHSSCEPNTICWQNEMVLSELSTMCAQSPGGASLSTLRCQLQLLTASGQSPGEINGGEMTGVVLTNIPTDTLLWLKMAIVRSGCWVSFDMYHSTSDLLQPTHLHERTHRDEVAHTQTVTYVHKHPRLLVVVMVFCSTLRCNGPRHGSVGAISLL